MNEAMQTMRIAEKKVEPFLGWVPPGREATPEGKRAPDGCDDAEELAAVAVLSTN